MGSCCGKESAFGGSRAEEPSAWQLATADDFYDSEHGELHDELTMIDLNPSGVHSARLEIGKMEDDLPMDDDQVVSLDFNLAPQRPLSARSPSFRRPVAHSTSSVRDTTEGGLVLSEVAAMNELRGSGSFTASVRSSANHSESSHSSELGKPADAGRSGSRPRQAIDGSQLDQTVIIRNSESVYSYTYGDESDSKIDRNLGGVLSGEDDEDSTVGTPLFHSTNSAGSNAAPPPHGMTLSPSAARVLKASADRRYLALGNDDSTEYLDAHASESAAT